MSTTRADDKKSPATTGSVFDTSYRSAKCLMSDYELANYKNGEVGYIIPLTLKQARNMFPRLSGQLKKVIFFSLHGADGIPIALTSTFEDAARHAWQDNLEVIFLN